MSVGTQINTVANLLLGAILKRIEQVRKHLPDADQFACRRQTWLSPL